MCVVMCLFSSWCLHINAPLWETHFIAWVKPKLSPVLPAGAGVGGSGPQERAHSGPNTSVSVHVAEFPPDRSYLTTVKFSSLRRLLHSLKFMFCRGKMWQSWKMKLFPLCYSTRCPLSCGFAWKQCWWEATFCFTPSFCNWDRYIFFLVLFFNSRHFSDMIYSVVPAGTNRGDD